MRSLLHGWEYLNVSSLVPSEYDDEKFVEDLIKEHRDIDLKSTYILVRESKKGLYEVMNGNHLFYILVDRHIEKVIVYNLGNVSLELANYVVEELETTYIRNTPMAFSEFVNEIVMNWRFNCHESQVQ